MIRPLIYIYIIFVSAVLNAQVINPVTNTPIPIKEVGIAYQQNFNDLVMADSSNVPPFGWQFREIGTVANNYYVAGNGSSNRGDIYSFGSTNSSDRALGSLFSSQMIPSFGVLFENQTNDTINKITVCYTGEQWRLGSLGRLDKYDVYYSLVNTSIGITNGWVDVNQLDFIAPLTTGTTGSKDGNLPANQVNIMHTISGISILPGKTFLLRFFDIDASNTDDGLAVDDFVLVAHKDIILPVVATVSINNFLSNVVQANSKVFYSGNDSIISRGIVIGSVTNPTISSNLFITSNGSGLGEFNSQIDNLLPNTTYYLRAYAVSAAGVGYGEEMIFTTPAAAKHYRTKSSGNWSDINIWETAVDTLQYWTNATQAPTFSDNTIKIKSGHHVVFNTQINIDQLTIETGATLERAGGDLTIQNGMGDDLIIYGRFLHSSGTTVPTFNGNIKVKTGGILEVITNNSTSYYGMNSNIFYENNATFYWNVATSATIINGTYFPNSGADEIPVFKLKVGGFSFGGNTSNPTIVNGIFEIEAGTITVQYSGNKVFRNGIRGNGNLVQKTGGNDSGPIIINGNTAEIGGSGLITLNNAGLEINSNTVLNLISGKTINQGSGVTTGTVKVSGTIDFKTFQITGGTNLIFNNDSKLITAHSIGVDGSILTSGNKSFSSEVNFVFNGVGPQSTGTQMPAVVKSISINNLSSITLSKSVSISHELEFIKGNITTSENNLLTLNSASIIGASNISFINGPVILKINSNNEVLLPVGKGSVYKPIGIIHTNNGSGSYFIQYIDQPHTNAVLENSLAAISHLEYWRVEPQNGTEAAKVKLYWNADQNFSNITNLTVSKFNGINWINAGDYATITGSSTAGSITSITSNNFNAVTFGFLSLGGTLPVSLIDFSGERIQDKVYLKWSTASEQNNSHFEIERSIDGSTFNTIGRIEGKINSNNFNSYFFIDEEPELQKSYYRLKQVDLSGDFEYHKVIIVNAENNLEEVSLYPIPATDHLVLKLPYNHTFFDMEIRDLGGRILDRKEISGDNFIKVDVSNFRSGTFFIVLKDQYTDHKIKWIKQ